MGVLADVSETDRPRVSSGASVRVGPSESRRRVPEYSPRRPQIPVFTGKKSASVGV